MNPIYAKTRFRGGISQADRPDTFAILTAYATTGEIWSEERNLDASEKLQRELESIRCWMIDATGYSPLDGHAEPGWAADIPLDTALRLGRAFLQDAIFWVADGELFVVGCAAGSQPWRLGLFDARLDRA
jgi:hypothetical protein